MSPRTRCALLAAAGLLAVVLSGCGAPFFISEQDLLGVLGEEYVYTASPDGVDGYKLDPKTGSLTALAGSPFGAGCYYGVSAPPGGAFLYTTPATDQTIDGFRVGSDGSLSELPGFPATPTPPSPWKLIFHPRGSFAYMLHAGTYSGIDSYTLDGATGALTVAGPWLGFGCSPQAAVVAGGGRFLYASDTGGIRLFSVDGASLTDRSDQATIAEGTPKAFAIHPRGYLYTTPYSSTLSNIYAYVIDGDTGALTQVPGSPYRVDPLGSSNRMVYSLALGGEGSYLYAAADDSRIHQFGVDPDTGALTQIGTPQDAPTQGKIGISGTERYVYVGGGSGSAGEMRIYRVAGDGTLSQIAGFAPGSGPVRDLLVVKTTRLP